MLMVSTEPTWVYTTLKHLKDNFGALIDFARFDCFNALIFRLVVTLV